MSINLNNRIWWVHLKASVPIPSELFKSPRRSWSQKRSNLLPDTTRERNRMPLPAEGWSCLPSGHLSTSRSEYCQHHLGTQGPSSFIMHMYPSTYTPERSCYLSVSLPTGLIFASLRGRLWVASPNKEALLHLCLPREIAGDFRIWKHIRKFVPCYMYGYLVSFSPQLMTWTPQLSPTL